MAFPLVEFEGNLLEVFSPQDLHLLRNIREQICDIVTVGGKSAANTGVCLTILLLS